MSRSTRRIRLVLLAIGLLLFIYVGSYVFMSVNGRFAPMLIEHFEIQAYGWEPWQFFKLPRPAILIYLPLWGLDQKCWHVIKDQEAFKWNSPDWCNSNAWGWAVIGHPEWGYGKEAVKYATRACELTHWADWRVYDTLAAAKALDGNFDDAMRIQQRAIGMAKAANVGSDVLQWQEDCLALYHQYQPYPPYPHRKLKMPKAAVVWP